MEGLKNIFEIFKVFCEDYQGRNFCDTCPARHLCNCGLYEKALEELKLEEKGV